MFTSLRQMNSAYNRLLSFLKMHFNIIIQSIVRSSSLSFFYY
jgi:hypothetical protein